MWRIACLSLMLGSCGMSKKECDAAVDAMTARLTKELRSYRAMGLVRAQVRSGDWTAPDEPAIAALATVAASEPTVANGIVLRFGTGTFKAPELTAAIRAARCEASRTGDPPIVYLAAPATTVARTLAGAVADVQAAKVEPRLLVQSRETVYSPWPPNAPADTKAFFEKMVADDSGDNKATRVAERVKSAIAGCPAIAKRFGELGEGADDEVRQLALPQGLRDCKCSGVDVAKVDAEHWLMIRARYAIGGLTLRAEGSAPGPEATLGEMVRELRLGSGASLAVGAASASGSPPPACEPGVAFEVTRDEQWHHPAPTTLTGYIAECTRWIDECRAELDDGTPLIELMIDVSLTGDAMCRWQRITGHYSDRPIDASECSKDRARVTFEVPKALAPAVEAATAEVAEQAQRSSSDLEESPDNSWGLMRIRRYSPALARVKK